MIDGRLGADAYIRAHVELSKEVLQPMTTNSLYSCSPLPLAGRGAEQRRRRQD